MNKEKMQNGLFVSVSCGCVLFVLACIGMVAAVVSDADWLGIACLIMGTLAALTLIVSTVLTFLARRWWLGVASVGAVAACFVIMLFAAVLMSVGQYKPPHHDEDEQIVLRDWATVVAEDSLTEALDNKVAHGSCWTDGRRFYRATEQGGKLVFEGGTLHEGGYRFALADENDTLRVESMEESDYTPFGMPGCRVARYKLEGRMEVLVAFNPSDDATPMAVLERFDGKELAYELAGIHDMLAGTYTVKEVKDGALGDSVGVWTFYADGKVSMSPGGKPAPYGVELVFDMPSSVLALPDGRHVQINKRATSIYVNEAVYDKEGECWVATDKWLYELTMQGDLELWREFAKHRLLRPSMLDMMNDERKYVKDLFSPMWEDANPITQLNLHLLNEWSREEDVVD